MLIGGAHEEALQRLEGLLEVPYEAALTIELVRLHPVFDGLRDLPGFQALLRKHGAEAAAEHASAARD